MTEPDLIRNLIDGRWEPGGSRELIDVVDPSTETVIARIPAGSSADVDQAVAAARAAYPSWSGRPLEDRLAILSAVADRIEAHVEELAGLESREMGRPVEVGAAWIGGAVAGLRHTIELARGYPFVVRDDSNTTITRRPLGVAAVITPWNFGTNVIVDALGPILAAGNTAVLKPSEKSPLSATRLVELFDLPPGVLNLVHGDSRAGAPLSAHPDIALAHFTGSVAAGRAIAASAAAKLHRVVLELGGKDPVIVDQGVDVPAVAADVARGSFINSGQICTSIERIYVHRAVADEFIEALTQEALRHTPAAEGSPWAIGPMVDARQREVVRGHVEEAVREGAGVRAGGFVPDRSGYFYPATVLTGVTDTMTIMREETFGPVAPVQVVDSFEEGLDRANNSPFGLAATVYTRDPEHAAAAATLNAGVIWVNRWQGAGANLIYEPAGQSGLTPTGSTAAFDAATRPTSIVRSE